MLFRPPASHRRVVRAIVLAASAVVVVWVGAAPPQGSPPPVNAYMPRPTGLSGEDVASLKADMARLADRVAALKAQYPTGAMRDRVADVEVFWSALHNQIDRDLRTDLARARRAVQTGLERSAQLAAGQTPWMLTNGVRGFYSRIDGSAQPYILNLPVGFAVSDARRYRLDVFLHGRDDGGFELNFFNKSTTTFTGMPFNPGPDRFILQPYGRYSNASRFAGETDVLEAIASVQQAYAIDENRVVIGGFSMGGASAWHLALHHADRWAASSAGAGFAETAQYLKLTPATMPPDYQQTLWRMYDAKDYALNAFNSPTVAYSGEIDPQKQAADVMEVAMRDEGLTLERMIGPATGHSYEPATRLALIARLDELAARGRNPAPQEIRFTTWMLRYHRMYWVEIDGMDRQWERARVHAKVDGTRVEVTSSNVSALRLNWARGLAPFAAGARAQLVIDGSRLTLPPVAADRSLRVDLIRQGGESGAAGDGARWRLGAFPATTLRKKPGLQGPIDDAFMESFLIVRPTGTARHEAIGRWTEAQLAYAVSEWQDVFRGDPRITDDTAITAADIAAHNLVIFGDPTSNAFYRRIASRLPITWTASEVIVGARRFPAAIHVPVLIFPNPLNPAKYVVINSGFTFHDPSSNSRQSPKLPDWAVVNVTEPGTRALPMSVTLAGFFDERWRLGGGAAIAQR